jgi:hypothetical protein
MPQEEGSRTCSTLFFCLACVGPTSGHWDQQLSIIMSS